MGTHQGRLDAKGRVSIPASFRAVLRAGAAEAVGSPMILRPSHTDDCIEGWPPEVFAMLQTRLDSHDQFSPQFETLATAIFGEAYPMETDREGRIVLPEMLAQFAQITEGLIFIGRGRTFQIWEPRAGRRYLDASRAFARTGGLTLPALNPRGAVAGAGQNFVPPQTPGTPAS